MSIPKYSIILPVRNGKEYLSQCIETVVGQNFNNYELIISDNYSSDGTSEYLDSFAHPNVKVIKPSRPLSMVEHFEFALSHAKGDWQIFLGVDDGLQLYFFELAEALTKYADLKKIRTIFGIRAYFFWRGCQKFYGNAAIRFKAENYLKIKKTKSAALKALFGLGNSYFDLPQMYSTSIFRKELLDEVRMKQEGKVFLSVTPDANLASICCSLEKRYLKSGIPLGWVGTSPKSNGFCFSSSSREKIIEKSVDVCGIKEDFEKLMGNSPLEFNCLAGNFKFGSVILYFWEALLQTKKLRKKIINDFLLSKLFKTLMFSSIFLDTRNVKENNYPERLQQFKKIVKTNNCRYILIIIISYIMFIIKNIYWLSLGVTIIFKKIFKAVIYCKVNWSADENMDIILASVCTNKLVNQRKMIKKLISSID